MKIKDAGPSRFEVEAGGGGFGEPCLPFCEESVCGFRFSQLVVLGIVWPQSLSNPVNRSRWGFGTLNPLEVRERMASGCRELMTIWGFPKIRGTILGVPILRIIVYWGLYWSTLILGNDHIDLGPKSTILSGNYQTVILTGLLDNGWLGGRQAVVLT